MSDFSNTLDSLIPLIGGAAVAKAQQELDDLKPGKMDAAPVGSNQRLPC